MRVGSLVKVIKTYPASRGYVAVHTNDMGVITQLYHSAAIVDFGHDRYHPSELQSIIYQGVLLSRSQSLVPLECLREVGKC